MKTPPCLRSAIACAALVVAACASSPVVEKYVPMAAGSSWVTQQRHSGSYIPGPAESPGRVVQVNWNGQPHLGFQGAGGTVVALPTGDWVAMVDGQGKPVITWDPPIGYNWPLEVGKGWTRSYKMTNHAANRVDNVEARTVVEAYEEVTVPAGTFKAFRVHTTDNLGNDNLTWWNPDTGIFVKQMLKRTERSPLGAGTRETEIKSLSVAR